VFVKIDGVTCEEDALVAGSAGADAVGFVFAPSPRQMEPAPVRAIVDGLPESLLTVGVFVDESPERVVEIMNLCRLGAAQLHGAEPPDEVRSIRSQVGTVFKAIAADSPALANAADYGVDAVIVDTPGGGGGSGQSYDWSLALAAPSGVRVILAGGLTPSTVADAIRTARPWGVDVSSGVESAPGRKDHAQLHAFVEAAKSAL
jgi:phosphoribosylanthranilate isomerase